MNILEKDIEDLLWSNLHDCELLISKGLPVDPGYHYIRQPELGGYGRPDIVGFYVNPKANGARTVNVIIIELKKEFINIDTLTQAYRYKTGIERFVEERYPGKIYLSFSIFLIGKKLDKNSDFVFLLQSLREIRLFTYSLDFKTGILFEKQSAAFTVSEENLPRKNETVDVILARIKKEKQVDLMKDYLPF